jgi:F-type H+-transporting ATPase subunit a
MYTPFIGTLFMYILLMNLMGLVPMMKSSTTSWSVTLALAITVFVYVQYAGIKELGFLGYIDHLLGKPRGIMALSVVMPLMMLFLHVVSELVRPISLSLRLRSNIWGDDMLLSLMAGFGLKGMPLLLFNSATVILASVVQATVFCLLTTIYFALVLSHEEA